MPTLHPLFFSQVHWFRCDVTSESDWVRLWESTEEALGKVDILVNNAGILYQRGWRKCVEVCLVREKTFYSFLKYLVIWEMSFIVGQHGRDGPGLQKDGPEGRAHYQHRLSRR